MRNLIAISLLSVALAGCASVTPEQLRAAKDVKQQVALAVPEIKAEIAKLSPGDPVRRVLDAALNHWEQADKLADATIRSAETKTLDPALVEAAGGLPWVGPYVKLAVLLGTFGWGLWERFGRKKTGAALRQTVAGVEAAKAADPALADALHPALDAAQDEATKVEVAAIRAAFPSAPEPDAPKEIVTK